MQTLFLIIFGLSSFSFYVADLVNVLSCDFEILHEIFLHFIGVNSLNFDMLA